MTLPRVLLIAACSWSILAAVGTTGWCAFVARWRRFDPAREYDRITVMTELPPVPQSDKHWLDVWPSGAHLIDFDAVHGLLSEPRKLEQQQVDRMFCEIVAIEGLQ